MARLIAVLVLLFLLAPSAMAEPSQGMADHGWIGDLWHRLMTWLESVGAHLGIQAEPAGIGAHVIPEG